MINYMTKSKINVMSPDIEECSTISDACALIKWSFIFFEQNLMLFNISHFRMFLTRWEGNYLKQVFERKYNSDMPESSSAENTSG